MKKRMAASPTPTQELARLSDVAYSLPQDRQAHLERLGLHNQYMITDNHEHSYTALHQDKPLAVVVHRGTSLEHGAVQDLGSDASIVTNDLKATNRYKDALARVKRAKKKYMKTRTVVTTGHSLGGALAHTTGQEANVHSHAFNPGTSPSMTLNGTNPDETTHHHIHLVKGDWINSNTAIRGQPGNTHLHHYNGREDKKSHSVENFF